MVALLSYLLLALDPQAEAERIRAAMQPGITAQLASVRRQTGAAKAVMNPWPVRWPASPRVSAPPQVCEPVPEAELHQMLGEAARRNNLRLAVLREIARKESGFRPCAISPAGAEGLMQLMPATQAVFGVADPFDAKQNLEAGSRLLRQLLDRYHGNLALALSAYNAGPATVDAAGGVPAIAETQEYVKDIVGRSAPVPGAGGP